MLYRWRSAYKEFRAMPKSEARCLPYVERPGHSVGVDVAAEEVGAGGWSAEGVVFRAGAGMQLADENLLRRLVRAVDGEVVQDAGVAIVHTDRHLRIGRRRQAARVP